MNLRTLAAALLAAALLFAPTTRASVNPSELVVVSDDTVVTLRVPPAGSPVDPDEPLTLDIDVAGPGKAVVTVRTPGMRAPAGLCRGVDAPDPEYANWLVCGTARGPWSATLVLPSVRISTPACPVGAVPIEVSVTVDNRRVAGETLEAFYRMCYTAHLPVAHQ